MLVHAFIIPLFLPFCKLLLCGGALNKKIAAGQVRKTTHGANWTSVNINTIVDRFTPGATPELVNGKVKYVSTDGRYEVVADIGGGYLRIFDNRIGHYADEYGHDVRNHTDNNGKQHGRSKAEQQVLTHLRILKKEEM